MFWHYGMYREQDKERKLTYGIPTTCWYYTGFLGFFNALLLIIRAILYVTGIAIF